MGVLDRVHDLEENDMKMIRMAAFIAAASAAVSKARDYARENPDKASQTIDKVEAFVAGKAGPKYADKVGKGSDALRSSLGLSAGAGAAGPAQSAGTGASTVSPGPGDGTSGRSSGPTDGPPSDGPPRAFDPSI
jgi:hypothetical protein